ncbi:MAG: TetR/AcrR family transcriptional regulator [Clostridia bacterium]|nr:TetR/AcrR family transcriptional regulator [Clostridia bacterium]
MAAPKNDHVKEQILDAAMRLLREQPDVSLAEVAAAANVSKGTLYYHYASKAELYLDVGERYWQKLADSLLDWVDNPGKDSSLPRLVRYAISYGVFDESGPIRLHLFADAIQNENQAVREALIRQYSYFQEILRTRISARRPDGDGENLAWLLLALIDGLMVQHTLKNPALDVPQFIEFMTREF